MGYSLIFFCLLRFSDLAVMSLDVIDVLALLLTVFLSSGFVSFSASPSESCEYDSDNEMLFVSAVTAGDPPHSAFSASYYTVPIIT